MQKSPCIVPTSVSAICNDYYSMFAHDTDVREEGIEQGIEIGLQRGIAQGIEQGVSQGSHDKAVETARNLLCMGLLSDEQIAQATGLSVQQLAVLAKDLKAD